MVDRATTDFPKIDYELFESYSERMKEYFVMRRENGIIEVKMCTNGGPAIWSYGMHNGFGKMLKAVGQDPENEVLIFGGAGDTWQGPMDPEYAKFMYNAAVNDSAEFRRCTYDHQYTDGNDIIYPLLYDIHIPTIAVVNGPSPGHTEFPLMCDITICAPDATFVEPHFANIDTVTGDGVFLVFEEVFGIKMANQMAMMGRSLTAQEAYDLGAVAEIVEKDKVYDRAWEIAENLMQKNRYTRRLQHEIANLRWRRVINSEFTAHFMAEGWAQCMHDYQVDTSMEDTRDKLLQKK